MARRRRRILVFSCSAGGRRTTALLLCRRFQNYGRVALFLVSVSKFRICGPRVSSNVVPNITVPGSIPGKRICLVAQFSHVPSVKNLEKMLKKLQEKR
jgi:hypothetical protein